MCDPPNTVTVARAVRTGMVNSEQVYSPSSDSWTSAMVMESSVGVERCSWIRLSLKAGETNKISMLMQVFLEMLIDIFIRDTVLNQCVCVIKPSGIRKHRTGIQKVKIFTTSKVS